MLTCELLHHCRHFSAKLRYWNVLLIHSVVCLDITRPDVSPLHAALQSQRPDTHYQQVSTLFKRCFGILGMKSSRDTSIPVYWHIT